MLDHLSLPVRDYARSQVFYDALLATLGHRCVMEQDAADYVAAGYGEGPHEPAFWIGAGTDNGAPGLRPHYHENHYATFVVDPDGHHLEAVCHLPA